MTKLKWTYVAKGHYSTLDDGWTVHVLDNGAVYKTHPSRATATIPAGSKADKYIESAQTKFPVRGKRRAEPAPDPKEKKETPRKETKPPKTKKRVTKKQISAAAKKLAKGAGTIIGTTRAFVTEIGEAEERTYAKRKAPPPKKKTKPVKKKAKPSKVKPPATGRPTIVRKMKVKPPRAYPGTEHPLEYLISGGGALPQTGRKRTARKARGQTLEEFMGY